MKDESWRWIAWLILGIGSLIVAGGLALGQASLRLVLHGERAEAEIVELQAVNRLQAPILRFRLPNGAVREVMDTAEASPKVAVGDRVKILYRADNLDDFQIDDFERLLSRRVRRRSEYNLMLRRSRSDRLEAWAMDTPPAAYPSRRRFAPPQDEAFETALRASSG